MHYPLLGLKYVNYACFGRFGFLGLGSKKRSRERMRGGSAQHDNYKFTASWGKGLCKYLYIYICVEPYEGSFVSKVRLGLTGLEPWLVSTSNLHCPLSN